MPFIKSLNSYAAFLYPNNGKETGRINLYCQDGYRLYLIFLDPADNIPSNYYNSSIKTGVAYQSIHQYHNYVDLVRNEKPIWVTFNPDATPPSYVVYCAGEKPGENEVLLEDLASLQN